jgi:hypothetical protein
VASARAVTAPVFLGGLGTGMNCGVLSVRPLEPAPRGPRSRAACAATEETAQQTQLSCDI